MTTTNNYAFKKPGRKSLTSERTWDNSLLTDSDKITLKYRRYILTVIIDLNL